MLGASGLVTASTAEPSRAILRRFRRTIADLGADLYVADRDGEPVGVVHVQYVRPLTGPPEARLALLTVAPAARHGGIGRSLAQLAAGRARRRGCASLRYTGTVCPEARQILQERGWRAAGEAFEFDLMDGAR